MIFMAINNIYEKCHKTSGQDDSIDWIHKLYMIRVRIVVVVFGLHMH